MTKYRISGIITAFLFASITLTTTSVSAAPSQRIVTIDTENNLYLKDSGLTGPWVKLATGIPGLNSPKSAGSKIAFLENTGTNVNQLWAKEGAYNSSWILISDNVKTYDMTSKRIAVVMADGTSYIKEGGLTAQFQPLATNVLAISLSPERIGIIIDRPSAPNCVAFEGLCKPSDVFVKEYTISAPWKFIASGYQSACVSHCSEVTSQLLLTNDRIAYLNAGNLTVKEGSLEATWRSDLWRSNDVGNVALHDNRICLSSISVAGVYCKVGDLSSGYLKVSDTVVSYIQLSEGRIGLVRSYGSSNDIAVYEGALKNYPVLTVIMGNAPSGAVLSLQTD